MQNNFKIYLLYIVKNVFFLDYSPSFAQSAGAVEESDSTSAEG